MKHIVIVTLTAALVFGISPRTGAVENCLDCVLGLYDDPARTTVFGTSMPGTFKSIYLGIDYVAPEDRLTGIEFSISGMRQDTDGIIITGTVFPVQPAIILGQLPAPADTSAASMGTGGVNIAWQQCQVGSRTLARIDFIHFAPLVNKVFQVKRKYPTTNPVWRTPVIVRCDTPAFTVVRTSGNCYILNWDGNPETLGCIDGPVAVEQRAWSGVKALYR